ncbi:MAG TPA: Trk system potassium transporter TrkA [Bacteroidales bacterium]|nr:Trk system potassium transporter TrkA [Bacteroidales bacterium]
MNILIAGDSEITLHLSKLLANEKHNITVISPNQELIRHIESFSDLIAINGDSTSLNLLKEIQPKRMDLLLSVHVDGRINLLTAIMAKRLGVKKCIAKSHEVEALTTEYKDLFKSLGVDFLVSPEKIVSKEIVNLLKNTAATEIFDFSAGQLSLMLVRLEKNAPVIGKSLNEIALEHTNLDFRAVAIHRFSRTQIPKGTDVFQEGDLAYVLTKPEGISKLLQLGGKKSFEINRVMIAGGGTVGRLTALALERSLAVTLFEMDSNRCNELSEYLSNTLIINGDARNITLLEEENIREMDAFVAVTNNSETNILTCLLARKMGVKKTIAMVENLDFIDISQSIGIDTIINKKLATASYIIRFTMAAEVVSTKCLTGIDAEVFEFVAKADTPITKRPLRKLNFPEKAIVGGIIRNDQGFIATGDFHIKDGDRVVVFALPHAFHLVDNMFKS